MSRAWDSLGQERLSPAALEQWQTCDGIRHVRARKADEYIFRLYIGLWLELQGDLKRLNPAFQMGASNSMPVILAFMTCSLFCFLAAAYLFCSMRMFFSCKGFRHESKSFMRAPGLHILRSPLLGCEGSHQ